MAIKEKDKIIEVNTLEIPEELKELPQWVLWRAEWNEKQQQFSKVPYSFSGYRASSIDRSTWTTFDPILRLYERDNYDGIGFVLSEDDNYIILDIDNAVNPDTREITTDLAREMIQLTYCELSPSGTGIHCFFKGTLPKERKKKRTDLDIELYDSSRFMTVTGESMGQVEICDMQETINNIVERYFKPEIKLHYISNKNNHSIFLDDEIIKLMLNSVTGKKISALLQGDYKKAGFESPSEAVQSLLHYLAFYTGKDRQQMERIFLNYNNLTDKWYEKRGDTTWGQNELDTAIYNQIAVYEPNSSNSSISLKEMIMNIGNEERQKIREVFEIEKAETGKGGRCPDRISTSRCAVILNDLMKFTLLDDIDENTKLAMYLSDEGIYTRNYALIKRVISWLEPRHAERKAEEIIYFLKQKVDVTPLTNSPNLIPVNNGVFNRKTKELEPFTPKYVFTTKISTNYVDNPEPPNIDGWNFDNWLDEIACGDMEISTLLWQVINDSLNGNYTRKKAIFLVGKGNNGKGTFQDMLSNLIGEKNVASLKANEFDHEFKLSVLEGKTCVIGDDVPVNVHIDDSSNFKSVVTGDYVLVNVKNKQPYRAAYKCTVIQSTNGMPKFKDKTNGIIRRLLIVPFNADFNGRKENEDIKEKYLKDEKVLEYILYKAINLDFKKFITPSVSTELLDEYQQDNDPVYDFKKEEFDTWHIEKVPKNVVYDKYKMFCVSNGFLHLSERKFHKSFKEFLGNRWKEGRSRFYSLADLRSQVGQFSINLIEEGEQTRAYIKV